MNFKDEMLNIHGHLINKQQENNMNKDKVTSIRINSEVKAILDKLGITMQSIIDAYVKEHFKEEIKKR